MTINELYEKAREIYKQYEDEYTFIGIRFENKEREIGEICENSRHNQDREDERDFPEFGTEEYNEMYEFDGTSAWNLADSTIYKIAQRHGEKDAQSFYIDTDHCYIIAGQYNCNADDDLDDGEVVIEQARVIAQLF